MTPTVSKLLGEAVDHAVGQLLRVTGQRSSSGRRTFSPGARVAGIRTHPGSITIQKVVVHRMGGLCLEVFSGPRPRNGAGV